MTIENLNPRPGDFVWAQSQNANLKEPIESLKQQGWQYADIPTASNFNFLFNELGKWDKYLEGRIDNTAEDISSNIKKVRQDLSANAQEVKHNISFHTGKIKSELRELRGYLRDTISVLAAIQQRVMEHHPDPPLLLHRLPIIKEPLEGGIIHD